MCNLYLEYRCIGNVVVFIVFVVIVVEIVFFDVLGFSWNMLFVLCRGCYSNGCEVEEFKDDGGELYFGKWF